MIMLIPDNIDGYIGDTPKTPLLEAIEYNHMNFDKLVADTVNTVNQILTCLQEQNDVLKDVVIKANQILSYLKEQEKNVKGQNGQHGQEIKPKLITSDEEWAKISKEQEGEEIEGNGDSPDILIILESQFFPPPHPTQKKIVLVVCITSSPPQRIK